MPILQYETQVSPEGHITLPLEYRNRKVVISAEWIDAAEKWGNVVHADNEWPTPTDEQLEKMYTMCRGCLEGMTQEEFDQLREERIMGGSK